MSLTQDEIKLQESINKCNLEIAGLKEQLNRLYGYCQHYWVEGYIAEPIVYCKICQREILNVYPGISPKDVEKLVHEE